MSKYLLLLGLLLVTLQAFFIPKTRQTLSGIPQNSYPIRGAYIDKLTVWYGMDVAKGFALPGYAPPHEYNYIIFAFWSCNSGPLDIALAWSKISGYLGEKNPFGSTDRDVQLGMKKVYNQAGVKILVSAFGATEFPTTGKESAEACGTALGNFVIQNNLDGADIDWEDNMAMEAGTGEKWLIDFTIALRKVIPDHIISHAPQAPYFKNEYYKNGGYITVHKEVGDLINFYNIQFYNQGDSKYNTYSELIEKATGFLQGPHSWKSRKEELTSRNLLSPSPSFPMMQQTPATCLPRT